MKRIISASRRTDIPAFYGNWFMERIKAGYLKIDNPYNSQQQTISLKLEDVNCIVFWSKNFAPFIKHIKTLKAMGYNMYFNYTINQYLTILEPKVPSPSVTIKAMSDLVDITSSDHINWRYDPIFISNLTPAAYHLHAFETTARLINEYTNRCFTSFVTIYDKLKIRLKALEKSNNVYYNSISVSEQKDLAEKLAKIAKANNIQLYACCSSQLLSDNILPASCIDGNVIKRLFGVTKGLVTKGTRKECNCTKSIDIGKYNTCPHKCVYCYANKA